MHRTVAVGSVGVRARGLAFGALALSLALVGCGGRASRLAEVRIPAGARHLPAADPAVAVHPRDRDVLLAWLEEEARGKGLTVDRETLKTLVATSLRSHKIAKANDVGNALERVA